MAEDLTDWERAALTAELGDGTEEWTNEYAVVYRRRGGIHVQGPLARPLAERKAREKAGVVAERTKTTFYGSWKALDSLAEEG